jgi:hypothetical protein
MAKVKTTFFVKAAEHRMLNGKGSVTLVKNGTNSRRDYSKNKIKWHGKANLQPANRAPKPLK